MNTIHVDETRCLACGKKLDAVSGLDHDHTPKPGDPILCIRCGAAATIAEDGRTLRPFTEEEATELRADRETMAAMGRVVTRLRILTASRN